MTVIEALERLIGGAVIGCLLSGWIFFWQLLVLRRHVDETRKIMERSDERADLLRGKVNKLEGDSSEEPRSMWS